MSNFVLNSPKMCKILFTVFLLLFTKLIHSQNNLDTIYFDENWEKITQFKQKRGLSLNFYQSQKPNV